MFSRFRATAPPCACRPNPAAGTTPQRTRPDRACVTGAGTIDFQEMGQGKEPVRRPPARPHWQMTVATLFVGVAVAFQWGLAGGRRPRRAWPPSSASVLREEEQGRRRLAMVFLTAATLSGGARD